MNFGIRIRPNPEIVDSVVHYFAVLYGPLFRLFLGGGELHENEVFCGTRIDHGKFLHDHFCQYITRVANNLALSRDARN